MTGAPKRSFVDKEEWVTVNLIVEELAPKHPIRMAFAAGADTMDLLFMTTDFDMRTRL